MRKTGLKEMYIVRYADDFRIFCRNKDCLLYTSFVAALNDLPILTGDNVISVGADAFLVCPADKMCAFIKGISQDMADPCAPPRLSLIHI